jgi:hypothetical protein
MVARIANAFKSVADMATAGLKNDDPEERPAKKTRVMPMAGDAPNKRFNDHFYDDDIAERPAKKVRMAMDPPTQNNTHQEQVPDCIFCARYPAGSCQICIKERPGKNMRQGYNAKEPMRRGSYKSIEGKQARCKQCQPFPVGYGCFLHKSATQMNNIYLDKTFGINANGLPCHNCKAHGHFCLQHLHQMRGYKQPSCDADGNQ